MTVRKSQYDIVMRKEKILKYVERKVRKFDHVIMMSAVCSIGRVCRPVLIFASRELHFQTVNNDRQTYLD